MRTQNCFDEGGASTLQSAGEAMPDSPRKRMHKRTHSDEYITGLLGSDPKRNRNVEWLNTPYLLPAYIFFIALFYGAVRGTELVDAGGASVGR